MTILVKEKNRIKEVKTPNSDRTMSIIEEICFHEETDHLFYASKTILR